MNHRQKRGEIDFESGSNSRSESGSESGSGSGAESHDSEKSDSSEFTIEKLQEYAARKHARAQRVAKRLKTSSAVARYSNDNNRFGDPNLNEGLVWRKKIERQLAQGLTPSEMSLKAEK